MSTFAQPKKPWTANEIACIIGYADYCMRHDLDYSATVAAELSKISPRSITWNTVQSKLRRTFISYGIASPSVSGFISQGATYLNVTAIPSDVRTALDIKRHQWGLSPLHANTTASGPSAAAVDEGGSVPSDSTVRESSK